LNVERFDPLKIVQAFNHRGVAAPQPDYQVISSRVFSAAVSDGTVHFRHVP
jgi:hypothetical protein